MNTTMTIILAILGSDAVVLLLKAGIDALKEKRGKKSKVELRLDSMESKLNDISKHEEENYLSILRLTVMDEAMPMSERLIAGQKYIEGGGNGDVKHFYMELKEAVDNEAVS